MSITVTKKAAYDRFVALGDSLKTYLTDLKADMEAGPVSGNALSQLLERMIADKDAMTEAAAVTGIAAYVASAESTTSGAVSQGFTDFMDSLDACGLYLINNITTDNWVTYSASGVSTKTFSTAATATLRTKIQDVIDEIL